MLVYIKVLPACLLIPIFGQYFINILLLGEIQINVVDDLINKLCINFGFFSSWVYLFLLGSVSFVHCFWWTY